MMVVLLKDALDFLSVGLIEFGPCSVVCEAASICTSDSHHRGFGGVIQLLGFRGGTVLISIGEREGIPNIIGVVSRFEVSS